MKQRSTWQLFVISYLLLLVSAATISAQEAISATGGRSGGFNLEPAPISGGGGGGDQIQPSPTPISGGTPPVTTLAETGWTGATDTTWSTTGNWSGGVPGSTDAAQFTGTFTNQPNLTSSASVGAVWMTGTLGQNVTLSASSGSLTINGTTITGNGTTTFGILVDNSDQKTLTISAPIILGGDQTWRSSSVNLFAVPLTINGSVDTNGKALTIDGTGDSTVNGAISGSGSITKSDSGTLILSGINSYSGGITLSGGLLELKSSSALGSSSGSLTVNGGILDLNGQNINVGNLTGTAGTIWNNGPNAGTGTVTLTIGTGNAGGGNYAGVIQDNNPSSNAGKVALTKTGTGTITLSGTNTYTGVTTVNGGKLFINGDQTAATGTTTVNNSGSVLGGTGTIGSAVTLASSGAILEAGTGSTGQTLTVKGALTQSTTGSILQLALGASGTHSTLALTGAGVSSFYLTQHISFIDVGATTGTYDNIITGVTSAVVTTGWMIDNAGWTGAFTYDALNQSIDLNLIAVPEPGTWIAGGLALLVVGYSQRKRFVRLFAHA